MKSRLFYLLPKLFVGDAPLTVKTKHVSLEVSSPHLSVVPGDKKIRLNRPFPNKGYVVGHDKANRIGWFVSLPCGLSHFDLTFLWNIHVSEHDYRFRVEHLFHVDTMEEMDDGGREDGEIWSMDVMPWYRREGFYRGEPQVNVQPASRLAMEEIHSVRNVGMISADQDGIAYEEYLFIPPVSQKEFIRRWIGVGFRAVPAIPSFEQEDAQGETKPGFSWMAGGGE